MNCLFAVLYFWYSANLSNGTGAIHSPTILTEKVTLQTDKFIHYLAEKLPEMLVKLQLQNSSHPISSSNPTNGFVEQNKLILSNLLRDYLHTMSQVQASMQVVEKKNDIKSYTLFCSTSTDT